MKKILSILIIVALSTILALGYNASTNLALRLLEATDDVRPFREDFNYNFELVDDIFDNVSLTEFAYLDGVTSAIQTQLNAKQTLDAQLTDIAGLTPTDNYFIVGDGVNFVTETGATARISLGIDLSLYYLKTEIDALSEWETIWSKDVLDTTELNTFSELQALVANKTLVNEEDIFTIDANWVNTANPWADNEVSDTLTASNLVAISSVVSDSEVDDDITIELATLATTFTVTDNENEALACLLVFVDGATGAQGAETDGDLTYNPSTGVLTSTAFAGNLLGNVTGNLTGEADTVTGFTPASGSLTLSGADALTLTTTAATNVTLPTTGTLITNAANTINSDQYVDASIDHEHLSPDVISGMTDVTSTDSDYILIWDATDSALKKCDMGEVRGAGVGDVTKVGTPVNNQIGVWTGDGTIEGDANLTYDGTTVVLGTGQINFPDSQNASGDANTLDDYEEGTWTPTLKFGGGTTDITYSIQAGLYTKIGRKVAITFHITLTSKGSSTGSVTITGLPFASKNADGAGTPASLRIGNISFADHLQGFIPKNSATIFLTEVTNAGVEGDLLNTDFENNSYFFGSATYFTE